MMVAKVISELNFLDLRFYQKLTPAVILVLYNLVLCLTCLQEVENNACTDGMFGKTRLFTCAPKKAFFVHLHKLAKDGRFTESHSFIDRRDSQRKSEYHLPSFSLNKQKQKNHYSTHGTP